MAKKSGGTGKKTIDIVDLFAYVALVTAAVIFLINVILKAIGGNLGTVMNVMSIIRDVAILGAIGFGGWSFARRRNMVIKVLYIVALVTYLVCMILFNTNIIG